MNSITPELALIDPDLAATARALLPEPGAFRPAWRADSAPVTPLTERPALRVPAPGRPAARSRLFVALSVVGVAAGLGVALALTTSGVTIHRSITAADAGARSSARVAEPLDVGAAGTYLWPSVPGARGYRITIMRGGAVVFERTTTKPTLDLPVSFEFPPGRYTLSATPQLAGTSHRSPARPVIEETFVIPAV